MPLGLSKKGRPANPHRSITAAVSFGSGRVSGISNGIGMVSVGGMPGKRAFNSSASFAEDVTTASKARRASSFASGNEKSRTSAQIGRASCRERVCQYGVDLGGRRIIKKKKRTSDEENRRR